MCEWLGPWRRRPWRRRRNMTITTTITMMTTWRWLLQRPRLRRPWLWRLWRLRRHDDDETTKIMTTWRHYDDDDHDLTMTTVTTVFDDCVSLCCGTNTVTVFMMLSVRCCCYIDGIRVHRCAVVFVVTCTECCRTTTRRDEQRTLYLQLTEAVWFTAEAS